MAWRESPSRLKSQKTRAEGIPYESYGFRVNSSGEPTPRPRRPHRIVAVKSRRTHSVRPPLRGCCAALRPLRGDCAAPMRRLCFHDLCRAKPAARPARSTKIMEAESLSRAEGSRLARIARRETGVLANALWRATRETGLALTPSTDQAQRTGRESNFGVRIGRSAERPSSDELFTRKPYDLAAPITAGPGL